MNLSVSFRHSARAEFIEAAAWYESERQNLGVEFIAEIERCVATAAERPMAYTAVHKDVRRVIAKRFPFSVYFRASHVRIQPSSQEARVGRLMLKIVVTAVVIF
jgi:toxin ParE1/3/4